MTHSLCTSGSQCIVLIVSVTVVPAKKGASPNQEYGSHTSYQLTSWTRVAPRAQDRPSRTLLCKYCSACGCSHHSSQW